MRRIAIDTLLVPLAVVLASCGAQGDPDTSPAPEQRTGTAHAALRRLLDGDGIGNVKFGQRPEPVAARLGRLLGPPVGTDQIRNGYRHAFCGFYWEQWDGLGAASDGRLFAAELNVWFRNSRFISYSYGPNNTETDLNAWNQYASRPIMLATAEGLTAGDPLADGPRLYGRAFVLTTRMQGTPPNPRLQRLTGWRASTASGRIEGGIGITRLVQGAHGSTDRTVRHRSIVGVSAGVGPNTPCRCPCLPPRRSNPGVARPENPLRPPGWKGEWVQISGAPTGTTIYSGNFAPGSWHLIFCAAINPGYTGSGNAGNTGSGTTGNTGAG